jgi:hypothetical protein
MADMSQQMRNVTIKEMKSILRHWKGHFGKGLNPFLWGPPGLGKTDMFKQLAVEWGANCFSFLTSTMDPTDVVGIPYPNMEKGYTRFLPPYNFIQLTEKAEDCETPAVAIFDDLPASTDQVFNALLGVFHGRILGGLPIRDNVLLCATGNRAEDKAGAQEITTALANRFVHFNILLDIDEWFEWAYKEQINPAVLAFVKRHPECLNEFEQALESGDKAFATPRSVARVGILFDAQGDEHPHLMTSIAANCGDAWAIKFSSFNRCREKMVDPEEIWRDPENCKIPEAKEIDLLFATNTSLIAATKFKPTPDHCKAVAKYAMRLPHQDLAVVLAKDLLMHVVACNPDAGFRTEVTGSQTFTVFKKKFGTIMKGYMED